LYCHASSPIRRFADLVNQRILKWFIDGLRYTADDLEAVACRLNWRQKEIAGAERDYQFLKAIHAATKHEVSAKVLDERSAWVDEWKTIIRFADSGSAGSVIRLRYFCDRRKVAWKERMVFEKYASKV
jgi:exoribonuclease R